MRKLVAAACCGVVAAVAAGSAGATPPPQSNSCVGALVSNAAHFWNENDSVKGGFGAQAKALGVNPGEAIQAAATLVCDKH